jgi:hypothetical protein
MKTKIVVKCTCGKQWSDVESSTAAQSWWKVLDIVAPELSAEVEKRGDKKTTELALRLLWARHSAYCKEQGDKKPHESAVIQEITIETVDEVEAMKKSNTDV